MPKRFIKRFLPDHQKVREHKHLRLFGDRLHDPNVWHLNRRSVAGALGAGIFIAFIPVPGQMIIAAAAAIWLRINLPLAVATVWITNPFTFTPVFFFTYKVGSWILGTPHRQLPSFELSIDWLLSETDVIWRPLLIGSLLVGALLGLAAYGAIRLAWRIYVIRKVIRKRRRVRKSGVYKGRLE